MPDELSQLWLSKQTVIAKLTDFLPKLVLALVILFVGWIIAKVLRSAAIKLFKVLRVHEAAEKAGIEAFLSQGGIGFTMITLLGQIVYWFILFIAFLFAIDVFEMKAVEQLMDPVVKYIPNIFAAVIILIFGTLIGRMVQKTFGAYLRNLGVPNAEMVSATAHYLILFFVISAALTQLEIGGSLVSSAFQIAFGGLALAFGIAFGWGGKDVAKDITERIYKHFK